MVLDGEGLEVQGGAPCESPRAARVDVHDGLFVGSKSCPKATGVRHAWVKLGEGRDESWKLELSAGLRLAVCGYPRAIFGAEAAAPPPGQQPVAVIGEQLLAAAAQPPPPVPAGPGKSVTGAAPPPRPLAKGPGQALPIGSSCAGRHERPKRVTILPTQAQ